MQGHSGMAEGGPDCPEAPEAEDVLCAARLCGLTLCGADVNRQADGSTVLHPLLRIAQGGNLSAFLLYLAMELPGAIPIGLYPNLSEH